jgi:glycosyltransferase involved in cell wall biosynthesis
MRIVVDMQGMQSPASADRGVGRYTEFLVDALLRNRNDHEVVLALNGAFPRTFDRIKARFLPLIGHSAFAVWQHFYDTSVTGGASKGLVSIAQKMRERFLQSLAPDVIFSTNLQEGLNDAAVTSVREVNTGAIYCSTLHDVVPLVFDGYLEDGPTRQWYWEKISAAIASDIVLTVSEASRAEILKRLPIHESQLFALPNGYDKRLFRRPDSLEDPRQTLDAYGVRPPYFLYVGGSDLHKNLAGLVSAFGLLPAATQATHQLVLAGEGVARDARLAAKVAALGIAERVLYTGRVLDEHLSTLYGNCAAFVFPSLFEGFGLPIIEALACGAPVVASDTPAVQEIISIPEALFNATDPVDMAAKMQRCVSEPLLRAAISREGERILPRFSWDISAQRLVEILEAAVDLRKPRLEQESAAVRQREAYEQTVEDVRPLFGSLRPQAGALVAKSISETFNRTTRPTLYVDVSTVAQFDHRTGIQRVVRAISAELLEQRFSRPVRLVYGGDGHGLTAADVYAWTTFKVLGPAADATIDLCPGDTLLFLDLNPGVAIRHREHIRYLRNRGISVYHVVYDTLPLETPEAFWPELCAEFKLWAEVVASSDGAVCISRTVADKFAAFVEAYGEPRSTPFEVGHFHLGADINRSAPSRGMPDDAEDILIRLDARPTFLMVGTVEPRKAHEQTLHAFEQLWEGGIDLNLVIVGKMGWRMQSIGNELLQHREAGERLFWLQGISDEFLERVYKSSSALIAASEGEGFGLPLVEAAQRGVNLIARDIPVFREVAGDGAHYFPNSREPVVIARSVSEWLALDAQGLVPNSGQIQVLSWKQSAEQLQDFLEGRAARRAVWSDGNLCPGTAYSVSDPKVACAGFSAPHNGMRWTGSGVSQLAFRWCEDGRYGLLYLRCEATVPVALAFRFNGEPLQAESLEVVPGAWAMTLSNLAQGTNVLTVSAEAKPGESGKALSHKDLWAAIELSVSTLPPLAFNIQVPHTSSAVLWQGFSGAEPENRWSNGHTASIAFLATDSAAECSIRLHLKTFGRQRIEASFNGFPVFGATIDTQDALLRMRLPVIRAGLNRLTFNLRDARMPEHNDDRQLAIGIFGFRLEPGASLRPTGEGRAAGDRDQLG